jgi:hypothetical protein
MTSGLRQFLKGVSHPAAIIGALVVAGWISYEVAQWNGQAKVSRLDKAEIVVIRTPGGMLEISTLIKNEAFAWKTQHACPIVDCGKLLGATVSEIRVPVHYTYRIPLSETWMLKSDGAHYTLTVPSEEPSVPAAIDLTKMEIRTDSTWFSPNTKENRETLLRQLTPELTRRSTEQHYIDAQREDARKTVAEFAAKWMSEQGAQNKLPVKVIFKDETKAGVP